MGKVLEAIEPKRGHHMKDTDSGISRNEAAEQAGISKRQKDTALRVASLPEDEFEAATGKTKKDGTAPLSRQAAAQDADTASGISRSEAATQAGGTAKPLNE